MSSPLYDAELGRLDVALNKAVQSCERLRSLGGPGRSDPVREVTAEVIGGLLKRVGALEERADETGGIVEAALDAKLSTRIQALEAEVVSLRVFADVIHGKLDSGALSPSEGWPLTSQHGIRVEEPVQPIRCASEHPQYGQCALNAGHVTRHRALFGDDNAEWTLEYYSPRRESDSAVGEP